MNVKGGSLKWSGDRFFLAATKKTVEGVTKATIYTQGVIKEMVGKSGSGRVYKRRSVIHQASSPGQPPARDTGILASSISYEIKRKLGTVTGFVGPNEAKFVAKGRKPSVGLYLEKGTKHMAARPYLVPGIIKATPRINKIIKDAVT